MAMFALPLIGAGIGGAIGGTFLGVGAAAWGMAIGNLAATALNSRVRTSVSSSEATVQTIVEGAPRPIVFGTAPCMGNVIDEGRVRRIETTQTSGGKGAPKVTQTTVQLLATYGVRICAGPIGGILAAWRDGICMYDVRPGNNMGAANAKFLERTTFYLGDEEQLPDPSLEAIAGVGNVIAHRGTAYAVHKDDDITQRGSLPQWKYLVSAGSVQILPAQVASVQYLYAASGPLAMGSTEVKTFTGDPITTDKVLCFDVVNLRTYWYTGVAAIRARWLDAATDAVLADSQWVGAAGDSVWQAGLAASLDANGMTGLGGTIVQWSGREPPPGELDAFDFGLRLMVNVPEGTHAKPQILLARTVGSPGAFQYEIRRPNPALVDAGYSAHATVLGVGINPDGSYFAADFSGVEVITIEGEGAPEKLGVIVSNMHARTGASAPDVSDLMDITLPGLLLGSADYTGADVIESLRPVYLFDRLEFDDQIRYVRRGKDAVATLTIDDLVDETEEAPRDDAKQVPRKVHLFYRSPNANYEEIPATSVDPSPDRQVLGEASFRVPVVMEDEAAHQLARILHKVAFAEVDGEVKIAVRMSQLRLVAGHTINLDVRGHVRRLRIEQIDDAQWRRRLTCRMDRKTAVLVNPIFQPLPAPAPSESRDPGDTTLAVLDIGALREQDDSLGYYVAAAGDQPAWNTAVVQRSVDAGESFADVAVVGAAVVGRLVDAVPSASEHYTDTTNLVRVQLLRAAHELEPVSEASFLAGGGAFALEKADGGWEVLQYRDAEDEGDGVFALSTLHRGLLNSGPSAHATDALFVLLSGATKVVAQSSWLGKDLVHRAPTVGQSPEDAEEVDTTYQGRMQTEWPVASFSLARSVDTVSGTWAWRHRFGSDARPLPSVNFTGARVTLTDGTNTETFDTATPAFERELTGWDTPVTVTVATLNRITGPGPSVSGEI